MAEDVSKCHVCANTPAKPHDLKSECLENDDHGLYTSIPYVNLWNLWNGSLNADIMVIGQDFGQRGEPKAFVEAWRSGTYKNATDVALRHLIQNAFKIDVDKDNDALFFTNMANCYRKQKTTGRIHSGWLPICAYKYMARLIRIVRPKIIIVLGQLAFESLFCMDDLKVDCINPDHVTAETLAERMKYSYQIAIGKAFIRVFPVFHPGANSKRNRSLAEQEKDWMQIAEYYDAIR